MKKGGVAIMGARGIGAAIVRRLGFGKMLLLADSNEQTLESAAEGASYAVKTLQRPGA